MLSGGLYCVYKVNKATQEREEKGYDIKRIITGGR
nr:MAG TPA: hypothetical protein [Bacteriophage sp.]DAP35890.1 MAG TPA: hypothetical protein [Caudoviricetes sp.]